MYDKIVQDSGVYTDLQGLDKLHLQAVKNPQGAKKAVAQQFEAILVQMMLHSMREANKSFSSGLFDDNQMEFYQDIYDKQLSLVMSKHGIGLADAIERNIDASSPHPNEELPKPQTPTTHTTTISPTPSSTPQFPVTAAATPLALAPTSFNSQASFLKELWPAAKTAAGAIGVTPELLLAQAALETDWGKKILSGNNNTSSHNLFNIKADANWTQATTSIDTLEEKNGVLVKEKSNFKNYDSFMASFLDYTTLLKNNLRYSDALKTAADPQKFVQALQHAGYATDNHYADKILKIFSSHTFKDLIAKIRR
jgi:peptidoglycan hydrolase FlgJ